jgi:glycine hydroxymethyltransferase
MKLDVDEIVDAVKSHHALFKDVLPMIASENVTSRTVRSMMSSDLAHRYAEGNVGNRFYQGCEFVDVIEQKAIELAEELFTAEHVNVQPISGVNANIAAFCTIRTERWANGTLDSSWCPYKSLEIFISRYKEIGCDIPSFR